MKYYPPFGATDPNASYTNGNAAAGIKGSIPPAQGIEHTMRELVAVILAAGLTPDENNLTQLLTAINTLITNATTGHIVEYDAASTYDQFAIVKKIGTYELYGSKINGNTGNALPNAVDDANWLFLGDLSALGIDVDALALGTPSINSYVAFSDVAESNITKKTPLGSLPFFGVGQAWVDVSASRAVNTTYTNSSEAPIMVFVSASGNAFANRHLRAFVDGMNIGLQIISVNGDGDAPGSVSFVVPSGSTYSVSTEGGSITFWYEFK